MLLWVFILSSVFNSSWAKPNNLCPQELKAKPYNAKTTSGAYSSVVTDLKTAQSYFNEMKKESYGIPFQFVVDGCDMRAFLISKNLKEKFGVDSFRIALESERGNLTHNTPYTHEGFVEFNRHTATTICVQNPTTKIIEPYVLDPSFFDQPVPAHQWISSFTQSSFENVVSKSYYASMYSLNPLERRTRFTKRDSDFAENLRRRFLQEQNKMKATGIKPYGVGQGRTDLRGEVWSSQ